MKPDAEPKPAPGRMFVVGRVLDPDGKPVPDASVMVYAASQAAGACRLGPGSDSSSTGVRAERRIGPVPTRRDPHLLIDT